MKEYSCKAEDIPKLFPSNVEHIFDDDEYYFANEEGWLSILGKVKFHPKYKKDRFDCDNFADMVRVYMAENYGLNGCGKAYGHIPEYHCFNVLLIPNGYIEYEPQTKEIVKYPIAKIYWG